MTFMMPKHVTLGFIALLIFTQYSHSQKVEGVIQTHFLQRFNNVSHFRVQRVRITFKGNVNRYFSYDVMIDPRSPDINGVLRDAFFNIERVIPHHKLRIGQQKTQFGYENGISSTRLYTVNRAEVSNKIARGDVTLRDIGIGLIGNWPIVKGLRFEDAITVVNGTGRNVPDDTERKNIWGRVGLRYKGLDAVTRIGVSAANGDNLDTGDDPLDPADDFIFTFMRLGTDIQIDHNHFRLNAEYAMGENDVDGKVEELSGYYVILIGKTPWRAGPIVRYDVFDLFYRWTLGLYYGRPRDAFRILLNYEHQDSTIEITRGLYLWTQVRF